MVCFLLSVLLKIRKTYQRGVFSRMNSSGFWIKVLPASSRRHRHFFILYLGGCGLHLYIPVGFKTNKRVIGAANEFSQKPVI